MLNNSGYYNKCDDDLPMDHADLFVKSCGHYKLIHLAKMMTSRPEGRRDYQLLYVAEGMAHFRLGEVSYDVGKGGVFIYPPEVPQNYYYILAEKPDIFWLHFTGREAAGLLSGLGLVTGQPMQLHGKEELQELFEKIIIELRFERPNYTQMAAVFFHQLLITLSRQYQNEGLEKQTYHSMFDEVINRFHHDYQREINIAALAEEYHTSCSWFIREFKKYSGYSPKQYITNLRLQHARELLDNQYLSVNNVASLVGYENQLYFSRVFRKYTGLSPSEYREKDRMGKINE